MSNLEEFNRLYCKSFNIDIEAKRLEGYMSKGWPRFFMIGYWRLCPWRFERVPNKVALAFSQTHRKGEPVKIDIDRHRREIADLTGRRGPDA